MLRQRRSMSERSFVCLVLILVASVLGHGSARMDTDVLHYAATLEPDIAGKSVKGSVLIRFSTTSTVVELDCGELTIDAVRAGWCAVAVFSDQSQVARVVAVRKSECGRSRSTFTAHQDTAFDFFRIDNRSTRSFPPASGWSAWTTHPTRQR